MAVTKSNGIFANASNVNGGNILPTHFKILLLDFSDKYIKSAATTNKINVENKYILSKRNAAVNGG